MAFNEQLSWLIFYIFPEVINSEPYVFLTLKFEILPLEYNRIIK